MRNVNDTISDYLFNKTCPVFPIVLKKRAVRPDRLYKSIEKVCYPLLAIGIAIVFIEKFFPLPRRWK